MDKIVQYRLQYRIRAFSRGVHVRAVGGRCPGVGTVICPECRSETMTGAAFCGYCGTPQGGEHPGEAYRPGGPRSPGASASQFPRTPGDQYVANAGPGQHGPPVSAPPREFRLDLRRLSRADQTAGAASLASPALAAGPALTGPHVRLRRPMAGQRGRGQAGEPAAFPGQVGLIGIACFGREGGQVKDGRAGVDA